MMFLGIFVFLFVSTLLWGRFGLKEPWQFAVTWALVGSGIMTGIGYAAHFASNLASHC
jgi:hypothetical protein